MATNTPNLSLLKKNVVTDGHETFNIETMLNENWDKIDTAFGKTVYGNEIHGLRINENKNIEYYNSDTSEWVEVKSGSDGAPIQAKSYKIPATSEGQKDFEIPLETFDPTIDVILVTQNRTVLEMDEYTITQQGIKHFVTLVEPVKDYTNTSISLLIFKGKITIGEIKDIPRASVSKVGIVGLTNDLGVSETLAVTQKGVNDVANLKADKTQIEALNVQKADKSKVSELEQKISTLETSKTDKTELQSHSNTNATTTNSGHVQLSSAINSESETLAATPKAVKTAYDLAQSAFQQANDIKTKWASVVGNPLVSTDTQAQLQTKTQTIKNTLATNITNKGVSANGTETLTSLATKVGQIKVGDYSIGGYLPDINIQREMSTSWTYAGFNNYLRGCFVDQNNYVYSWGTDRTIKKLNSNGTLSWSYTHPSEVLDGAVGSDGYVYTGGNDSYVRKISSTGSEVWKFSTNYYPAYAVAVDKIGYVYCGTSDYKVRKLYSNGSSAVWTFTGHSQSINDLAVDTNYNVYSTAVDGYLRKITSEGVQSWQFYPGSAPQRVAVDTSGNVYIGCSSGQVYKINSSGTAVWSYITSKVNTVNDITVDKFGQVYFGQSTTVNKLTSVGLPAWAYDESQQAYGVAIGADGYLYIATSDSSTRKVQKKLVRYKILG